MNLNAMHAHTDTRSMCAGRTHYVIEFFRKSIIIQFE